MPSQPISGVAYHTERNERNQSISENTYALAFLQDNIVDSKGAYNGLFREDVTNSLRPLLNIL